MRTDAHGLPLTTSTDAAAAGYDAVIASLLRYRTDIRDRMKALLAADPGFVLAHCLRGTLALMTYNAAAIPAATAALRDAEAAATTATPRERAHVAALARWIAGDVAGATATWEHVLRDHPRDILAFRLSHFTHFWLGDRLGMLTSANRAAPHWDRELPSYPNLLACRAFALEEAGDYTHAEQAGREAVARDPGDVWGAHAVAHVMEMQGRHAEGAAWVAALAPNWEGANNLTHHLWWHCALYHLETGAFDTVLELYDTRFRDLAAPLTLAMPDLYSDVQNAASMLYRLERLGADVGQRWEEIADKAEARIGDCRSAFTLPHWMMALAAAGRMAAARRMLDAMRDAATGHGDHEAILREVAIPVCEAVLLHRTGAHRGAAAAMAPALPGLARLGGSHAQREVLELIYLDATLAAGDEATARRWVGRAAIARPVKLANRIGWRGAAVRLAA